MLSNPEGDYVEAAGKLHRFDRPALVVWATEDRLMKPAYGRCLAERLPHGRLVEVVDSFTLVPEDQPAHCARIIRDLVGEGPVAP